MDNDFPAVMANGGGKNFLSGFVKGMNKYSQAGTDVDDFEIERDILDARENKKARQDPGMDMLLDAIKKKTKKKKGKA